MKSVTYAWEDGYGVTLKVYLSAFLSDDGDPLALLDLAWQEDGVEKTQPQEIFIDPADLRELAEMFAEAADAVDSSWKARR